MWINLFDPESMNMPLSERFGLVWKKLHRKLLPQPTPRNPEQGLGADDLIILRALGLMARSNGEGSIDKESSTRSLE